MNQHYKDCKVDVGEEHPGKLNTRLCIIREEMYPLLYSRALVTGRNSLV